MNHIDLDVESKNAIIRKLQQDNLTLEYIEKEAFDQSEGQAAWTELRGIQSYDLCDYYYRIAGQKAWYRVALFEDASIHLITEDEEENDAETRPNFVKWLSERVEYSL